MASPSHKFFETQSRCSLSFLTNGEKVNVVTGFENNIFIGTNQGHIYICKILDDKNWKIEATLDLPKQTPIDQLISTSALGLLLLVSESTLYYVDVDTFSVASAANNVKYLALNQNPTVDEPFILQFSIATLQKEIVLGQRLADGKLDIIQKVGVDSNVLVMSYSKHVICYATQLAYYLYNSLSKTNLRLFDLNFDSGLLPPMVSSLEAEEFMMYGVGGLAIFVDADGISSRAPLPLGEPVVHAVEHKNPFLLCLTQDSLYVFSLLSQKLEQSLPITCSSRLLTNIDGLLFVVAENGIFEIVPVSLIAQIEELLENSQLEAALGVMRDSSLRFSCDESTLLKLNHLKQLAAFMCLTLEKIEDCLELLVESEADPREFIALSQQISVDGFVSNMELRKGLRDTDVEIVSLDVLQQYLQNIRCLPWARSYSQIVDTSLAKIFILQKQFSELDKLDPSMWNSAEFRSSWLVSHGSCNLAAKLAADAQCFAEAFELWRKLVDGEVVHEDFTTESLDINELLQIATQVKDKNVLTETLKWMTALKPAECMQIIQESCVLGLQDAHLVVEIFEKHPELLLQYLEKNISLLEDKLLHEKLFQLYVNSIIAADQESDSLRYKFRNFILFSACLDAEFVKSAWRDESKFQVEAILFECNETNDVDCLKKLIQQNSETLDLSAAEQLCSKFSNSQMLKPMLNLYLRLSKLDPVMRLQIPKILNLLESDAEVEEVLSNIPSDLLCSDLISSFLSRSLAHTLNSSNCVKLRNVLSHKVIAKEQATIDFKRAHTCFVVEQETKCHKCNLPLGREEFVRYASSTLLVHLRCHLIGRA